MANEEVKKEEGLVKGYEPFNFAGVIESSIQNCDENITAAKAQKQLLENIKNLVQAEGIIFLKKSAPEQKAEEKA